MKQILTLAATLLLATSLISTPANAAHHDSPSDSDSMKKGDMKMDGMKKDDMKMDGMKKGMH